MPQPSIDPKLLWACKKILGQTKNVWTWPGGKADKLVVQVKFGKVQNNLGETNYFVSVLYLKKDRAIDSPQQW